MDYRKHTQDRYLERYKTKLTDDDYLELCNICRSPEKWLHGEPTRNKATKVVVKHRGKSVTCVISKKSKIIKTVLHTKKNINFFKIAL